MPTLDAAQTDAVAAFAAQMGLEAAPDAAGGYSFAFEKAGRLSILAAESGDVLVSLTRPVILRDLIGKGAALAAGGFHAALGLTAMPGLTRSGQPVLTLAFPPRGFDLPTLDAGFTALDELFTQAGL
ncbi:hypothetical protein [Marivita sp. GX14005]|uniref:hypothetical protein n=1 Tax=Marivita sp. GX14005 TaxID=2942276 RepID=UPI002018BC3A|nr:hypothetical protein [Marivita sp. GX14005]MCL3883289.1 hypothetical protein [Marivita sp. GX14005]